MYHSISDEPETGHPYFWINTSPARFAEHMKFLHDKGYKVISLSAAVDLITGHAQQSLLLNPQLATRNSHHSLTRNSQLATCNTVVLTFDDGYHDFYTHAFPVLRQYGFTATVYLPTAFIDSSKAGLKGKRHLTWGEVKKLQTDGIEFGSHTVTHPQLHDLKPELMEREIKVSRENIENKTGRRVESFSYPYKFPEEDKDFVKNLCAIVEAQGFKNGVSTRIGTENVGGEIFYLKRVPVNMGDDIEFFERKLSGGFDWVYRPQFLSKSLRKKSRN